MSPTTTPPLSLRGLGATVPDGREERVLFDGVDLDVAAGEVVVVTGPSGSGKSTLLAVAGLLRRPPTGEVVVAGQPTASLSRRGRTAVRRQQIGIVYQSANLLGPLTAREQLELAGRIRRMPRRQIGAEADRLLGDLALGDRSGQLPAELSGGERQRVGIARALMGDPSVLLADEPTASLDPALAGEVAELLATEARRRGVAALIVTHDDAPLRHADRHLHLVGGQLVDGTGVAS